MQMDFRVKELSLKSEASQRNISTGIHETKKKNLYRNDEKKRSSNFINEKPNHFLQWTLHFVFYSSLNSGTVIACMLYTRNSGQTKTDGYYNLPNPHSTSSGNGGVITNSEGYSYVDDHHPSLQSQHHRHSSGQQKTSSSSNRGSGVDHQQSNRTRRTQRRVTHNEKRYHSG